MSFFSIETGPWTWRRGVQWFFLCGLLLVWSIPGTVALRNLFIVALALCLDWRPLFRYDLWREIPVALWAIVGLTVAILLHSLFLSSDSLWSLREFSGQWLKVLLLLLMGFVLARNAARPENLAYLLGWVAALLALPIIMTLVDACWLWWHEGAIPFGIARLTGSRTGTSYLNNLLLAFLVTDLLVRVFQSADGRRLLAWPLSWVLVMLVLSVFCSWLLTTRNGNIGVLFLVASSFLLYLVQHRQRLPMRRLSVISLLGISVLTVFVLVSYRSDSRWVNFFETVPVAWDIDHYDAWRKPLGEHRVMPSLEDGEGTDESAFLRLAWIHSGLRLVSEYPLGVGYGRNAYGHAMSLYFQEPFTGHSHSGLLDWTLGLGIPGLIFWLGVVALLFRHGWRAWFLDQRPSGLLLIFLVSGFLGRSLLDSNMRDHMMEMAFFLFGLLLAPGVVRERKEQ
ncbi:MAG TPA: O-antigen ligase family protein [Rhodocyclaceae bacterium]|jgi:hypothetical protein